MKKWMDLKDNRIVTILVKVSIVFYVLFFSANIIISIQPKYTFLETNRCWVVEISSVAVFLTSCEFMKWGQQSLSFSFRFKSQSESPNCTIHIQSKSVHHIYQIQMLQYQEKRLDSIFTITARMYTSQNSHKQLGNEFSSMESGNIRLQWKYWQLRQMHWLRNRYVIGIDI